MRRAQRATDRGRSRVANIKSQIKRIGQNERRRLRNKAVKSELKTAVRRFREAADAGDTEATSTAFRSASRLLDKAVSKGVIHKNQAANRKSAMAHRAQGCLRRRLRSRSLACRRTRRSLRPCRRRTQLLLLRQFAPTLRPL